MDPFEALPRQRPVIAAVQGHQQRGRDYHTT